MSEPTEEDPTLPRHPLTIPTLHLLAISRTIDLAFMPTLPHLRAHLATLDVKSSEPTEPAAGRVSGPPSSTLAIFGLLNIHRPTSEHSAQGLSRTLSIAVEASSALGSKLVIAEPLPVAEDENAMTMNEDEEVERQNPWMEQIPILNGSIRASGNQRVWAGRTIEVARVVGRWCRIVEQDED